MYTMFYVLYILLSGEPAVDVLRRSLHTLMEMCDHISSVAEGVLPDRTTDIVIE